MKGTVRRAFTIAELAVVLVIIGIICALSVPWILRRADRAHVRGARAEIITMLASARAAAVAGDRHVGVRFDSARGVMLITAGGDTVLSRNLRSVHGVEI